MGLGDNPGLGILRILEEYSSSTEYDSNDRKNYKDISLDVV